MFFGLSCDRASSATFSERGASGGGASGRGGGGRRRDRRLDRRPAGIESNPVVAASDDVVEKTRPPLAHCKVGSRDGHWIGFLFLLPFLIMFLLHDPLG